MNIQDEKDGSMGKARKKKWGGEESLKNKWESKKNARREQSNQ